MTVVDMARATRALVPWPIVGRREDGKAWLSCHLAWMLEEIIAARVGGDKAQRWLGFVQGVLVTRRMSTVDELREINRKEA